MPPIAKKKENSPWTLVFVLSPCAALLAAALLFVFGQRHAAAWALGAGVTAIVVYCVAVTLALNTGARRAQLERAQLERAQIA